MTTDLDLQYDADVGLYGTICHHQGIHTRMPLGGRVHELRENSYRAAALIGANEGAAQDRGRHVLATVLTHQDLDPVSPTYGIWGYYAEEPPSQMAPADYNWADFIGLALARLLHSHADRLDETLRAAVRTALHAAAYSIFRRNMGPHYTNIAVKGAVVCASAGLLLGDAFLTDYGARRLVGWVAWTRASGITEYNSPTYNLVALRAIEAGLTMVPSGAFHAAARDAQRLLWTSLAEHYHQPTAQIAGPFSRCYRDLIGTDVHKLLHEGAVCDPPSAALPCPADLLPHFRTAVAAAVERRHPFQAARGERAAVVGTTWMDNRACLGSVNRESLWWQRRPLIAYWTTPTGVAVAKLRVLKDEHDWASAEAHIVQQGPRALVGVNLLTDQGDRHPSLDRPAGGFPLERLRLRIEVHASDARVVDGHSLAAGSHRVVVHPLTAAWGNLAGHWTSDADVGVAWTECAFQGPLRVIDPAQADPLHLATAIELVADDATATPGPSWEERGDTAAVTWPAVSLRLTWPSTAQRYSGT